MATGILHTHILSVILFLVIYLLKTSLLLMNKTEALASFTRKVKVPEMIISTLFLLTGIYLLTIQDEINSLLIIKIMIVLASIPLAIVGFKKSNKVLATVAFLMIVAAYGLAEMSKKQKPKALQNVTSTTIDGKEIYTVACQGCHGADGKLMMGAAKDLSVSVMDITAKIELIRKGKNLMHGFEGMLTEEQIAAVADYTSTLKK